MPTEVSRGEGETEGGNQISGKPNLRETKFRETKSPCPVPPAYLLVSRQSVTQTGIPCIDARAGSAGYVISLLRYTVANLKASSTS